MKNTNNSSTKLILVHPYILKQGSSNRVWLLAFISIFAAVFLFTFVFTREPLTAPTTTDADADAAAAAAANGIPAGLPEHVMSTLVHYAANANTTEKMGLPEMKAISDALRKCSSPCNLLVFGLSHETLLWKSLNSHGRTVFIDENRYYAAYMEEKHPEIEAYDVQYTTKQRDYAELISSAVEQSRNECRPVQNLLFSDCKLALNDLPNQFYDLGWDLILVDGPRGHWPDAPGRMSSVFTASVLARTRTRSGQATQVFVHDYNMALQRAAAEAFLCRENLVAQTGTLAHFAVERMEEGATRFCLNTTSFDRSR